MVRKQTAGVNWTSSVSSSALNQRDFFKTQKDVVYKYLQSNLATASMVEEATGVKQKCVTWIKYDLEKKGVLWEVYRRPCKITGRSAWYLTTNPELKPDEIQLGMFD